jgi:hypothetical protein
MALNREEMMELLMKKFPDMYLRTTEEFYGEKEGTGIWCCSVEDRQIWKKILIFNYYTGDPNKYTNGVSKSFDLLLDVNGWYFEWNDPGTIMFYPI